MEYPYYKNQITHKKLLIDFNRLKNYQTVFLKFNPIKKKLNKFKNKLIIFREDYRKNKDLYYLTDYFSQQCRIKCLNNLKEDITPLEFFEENKEKIYNRLMKKLKKNSTMVTYRYSKTNTSQNSAISFDDLHEYIYNNVAQCTNFNTTVMISILKLLKPTRVLDPSAGWGDRLLATIAYGASYTGVDPSNCMYPIYNSIINKFAPKNKKKEYTIINEGFENATIEENAYDLVFTSPPFFDFEIYEKSEKQSLNKFNTLDKWLNGFLYPLIEKSTKALVNGGHFGLYISDYKGISFVKSMFDYINNNVKELKYEGDIHFWNQTKQNVVRTIFFWSKNTF
jgi:16S rRNA G966 N2-methylase RsmD